jgi:mannose-1-phosphate guanylyltransferase/mannose-1-phosphate guanylyltransferase/mannose-6-phosphate isomerase
VTRIVPVIMSGGSGTRLWPLSRAALPKQLHALVTDMTMVQETVRRVSGAGEGFDFETPIVVLNERQHDLARAQLEALGTAPSHYVVEPFGRNTAPVAAVAAELVRRVHGEEALILLLPADHHIRDVPGFRQAVGVGAGLAGQGHVVTFGIQPDSPETGYGYIQRGEALEGGYTVAKFTEKPDLERARAFLADGGYYWNAGIFLFGAGRLQAEMRAHCSDVLDACTAAVQRAEVSGSKILLDPEPFEACPSISFDYAVMERTDKAVVVPADVGWSDVGAWSALWSIADKDADGNAVRGDVELVGTRNSYVLSSGQKVGVIGVEDLVVVTTEDAVLVTRRDTCQDVKAIVERLKAEGRGDLL